MRAGALFWKWALSPPADPTDGLEVGMRDSTFLSYVAPSARAALDTARRASVPGCQAARSRPRAGQEHTGEITAQRQQSAITVLVVLLDMCPVA